MPEAMADKTTRITSTQTTCQSIYTPGGLSRVISSSKSQTRYKPASDLGSVCMRIRPKNRFHVALRLFSNKSQMTSKCGKKKKVAHEALAECVIDVLTTF